MSTSSFTTTTTLLGIAATLVHSGISFAGSYLVIPSLLPLPSASATAGFIPFYQRGATVVVPLAAIAGLSSAYAAYSNPEKRTLYTIAAVLGAASIPWTLGTMLGTNTRLVEIGLKKGEEAFAGEAVKLLTKWQTLNAFRAAVAFASGVLGLATFAEVL